MLRAIIAETDRTTREMLSRILTAQGFYVTCALDRADAMVEVALERPDILVVSTELLPDAEFDHFIRLAHACHPEMRLLLLTANWPDAESSRVKHRLSTPLVWSEVIHATMNCLHDNTATVEFLRDNCQRTLAAS